MTRAIVVFFAVYVLISCSERMVCPAYQSAFIYDKDELRKKFSYFSDTTPKIQYTASKTKYLIAEPVSYRTKIRSMQTVKMKPVLVQVPDSLSGKSDSVSTADLDRAARSIIDSTFIPEVPKKDSVAAPKDTIYVITKDKEVRLLKYNAPDSLDYDSTAQRYVVQKPKYYVTDVRYNLEQDHYMWYLRRSLVLPDARLAKLQKDDKGKDGTKPEKKKQGLKGFFKNLFKKKQKEEVDSAALKPPPKEEFDFIDPDTVLKAETPLPGQEDEKPRRKPKKVREKKVKKKKSNKNKDEVKPEEGEKKEDEDDGF